VFGSSVAAVGVGAAAGAIAQYLTGGNIAALQSSIDKIRDDAVTNMCNAAAQKGANAVIGMSCEVQGLVTGYVGAYCCGTAVTLSPAPPA
jgi:uncharacterized protein YbjQ (UPF0145 family)